MQAIHIYTFSKRKYISLCLAVLALLLYVFPMAAQTDSLPIKKSENVYLNFIEESYKLGETGSYEKAIEALKKAIDAEPKNPLNAVLLNNIAGLYQLLGQNEDALLVYDAAIKKLPNDLTIRHNRALLFAKMKKDKQALTDYSILIGLAPKNEIYLYQKAMIYLANKKYDLARNDLEEIIRLNDSSLKARLGYALLETLTGNFNEAERLYDYVIGKLPNNAEAMAGRARLFLARKMYGFALRDISRAFEISGKEATADMYVIRGEINLALKDTRAAHEDFVKAKSLDPQIVTP